MSARMNPQGVRYVNAYSPKDQENLHELHQLFPTADKNFVVQTYEAKKRDFEQTFKAIDQTLKYNQELNALARVPPEIKLSFLRLAFDKLNPDWIQQVLQRYNWSVEASLDDILRAEEARVRALEEQRRREEEERRKREEAERALIEAKRLENERQNVVIFCQSMFPYLPAHFVADIVARHGFNADAAAATLSQHEAQRIAHEQALQRQREEQAQREQEARRAAELREIEAQLLAQNQAKMQEKLPNLLQCQDWDQVAQLVLQSPIQAASAPADDQTSAVARAVAKANPKVDPKVIAQILKDNNFDVDASLVLVRAQEFNDAFQQMLTVFPDLSRDQVQDVLNAAFPDTGKAMQDLQPIATDFAEEKLLRESIQNETRFLAESKKKLAEWEAEKAQMMARRAERKRHLAEAKTPEERGFMQMVDEMQTQKEDMEVKQNDEKYRLDVATRESKIAQLQDKLEELLARRESRKAAAKGSNSSADDLKERKAQFMKFMSEETKNLESQQSDVAQKRQSMVARRLREQIGDDRFNELQKAIGRAPGGFSSTGVESPRMNDALPGLIAAQVRERSRASLSVPSSASSASPAAVNQAPAASPSAAVPRSPSAPSNPVPQPAVPTSSSNPFLPSNPFAPSNPFVPDRPVFAAGPSAPQISQLPQQQHQPQPVPKPLSVPSMPQQPQQHQQHQPVQQMTQSMAGMSVNPQPAPYSPYGAMPPQPSQQQYMPQQQVLHAPHQHPAGISQLVGSYQPQPQPQAQQYQPQTQMQHSAVSPVQQPPMYYGQQPAHASGVYQYQSPYYPPGYNPTQSGMQQQAYYYPQQHQQVPHPQQQQPQQQQPQQPPQHGSLVYSGYPGQYSSQK
eukprot:TRINITY_DN5571_c0_g2_i1.p1 TRINITY_DN5571_c0_g2~~TRINITY_DN5571_c0_g2_i1.p1  ORF type:complete len:855 (+),score=233.36 TRINITY_DN5571_c0_g2_i1:127-2691(+)